MIRQRPVLPGLVAGVGQGPDRAAADTRQMPGIRLVWPSPAIPRHRPVVIGRRMVCGPAVALGCAGPLSGFPSSRDRQAFGGGGPALCHRTGASGRPCCDGCSGCGCGRTKAGRWTCGGGESLARTMMADTGDRAKYATYQANADVIDWLEFLAVLDLRTSRTCMTASGRRFRLDDPEIAAFRPPLYPNCRSVLIPIIDLPSLPVG
ncbi:minor capsid protein [Thalassospira sp.]|uniref:minor capsid protein n=1 Tax=Thalassospira sp. TaxID=1912094 RepID=UPI00352455F3